MTFCHTTAGIRVIFRTHGRKADGGRTDRRGSQNSYLDYNLLSKIQKI